MWLYNCGGLLLLQNCQQQQHWAGTEELKQGGGSAGEQPHIVICTVQTELHMNTRLFVAQVTLYSWKNEI